MVPETAAGWERRATVVCGEAKHEGVRCRLLVGEGDAEFMRRPLACNAMPL